MSPIGGGVLEERSFQHLWLIPDSGDRLKETRELGGGTRALLPRGAVIKARAKKKASLA